MGDSFSKPGKILLQVVAVLANNIDMYVLIINMTLIILAVN